MCVMAGLRERHEQAAAHHDEAAERHDAAVDFWEKRGNAPRAELHRDAAANARQGAEIERRWAEIVASEGEQSGDDDAGPDVDAREATLAQQELASEMRDSQSAALRRSLERQQRQADARDLIANARERDADARERSANVREQLADEREGTAAAREQERLERLQERGERSRAAAKREQAWVDREVAASEREDFAD